MRKWFAVFMAIALGCNSGAAVSSIGMDTGDSSDGNIKSGDLDVTPGTLGDASSLDLVTDGPSLPETDANAPVDACKYGIGCACSVGEDTTADECYCPATGRIYYFPNCVDGTWTCICEPLDASDAAPDD